MFEDLSYRGQVEPHQDQSPEDKSARSPFGTRWAMKIRAPGCEVCPLPFRDPVSAALSVALELHHTSAALRADQVQDRGNDAGARFSRYGVDNPHVVLPCRCTIASAMPTIKSGDSW